MLRARAGPPVDTSSLAAGVLAAAAALGDRRVRDPKLGSSMDKMLPPPLLAPEPPVVWLSALGLRLRLRLRLRWAAARAGGTGAAATACVAAEAGTGGAGRLLERVGTTGGTWAVAPCELRRPSVAVSSLPALLWLSERRNRRRAVPAAAVARSCRTLWDACARSSRRAWWASSELSTRTSGDGATAASSPSP